MRSINDILYELVNEYELKGIELELAMHNYAEIVKCQNTINTLTTAVNRSMGFVKRKNEYIHELQEELYEAEKREGETDVSECKR